MTAAQQSGAAEALSEQRLPCPGRGLELSIVTVQVTHGPGRELIKIALDKQRSIPAAELDRDAVKQFVQQALSHLARTST